ncbi:hypothetical protein RclHR1_09160009 [Rhizophagus clarus]|uniref:Uncharacterized protein n=1 Tax=Rhizophagus clarus TaxID=94130 RepID=A0A2Z6S5Q5_9GLOM|nr:hypothetical protein RclHR1_09160009 [Rhizophagus clarus]GET04575.1 hypothetical protein RCL_jg7974.t1 [Rhizophagus clarus]
MLRFRFATKRRQSKADDLSIAKESYNHNSYDSDSNPNTIKQQKRILTKKKSRINIETDKDTTNMSEVNVNEHPLSNETYETLAHNTLVHLHKEINQGEENQTTPNHSKISTPLFIIQIKGKNPVNVTEDNEKTVNPINANTNQDSITINL